MKSLFLSCLFVLMIWFQANSVCGQSENQQNLVEVIRVAMDQNKLPPNLIHKPDSIFREEISTDYLAIQATQQNHLERDHPYVDSKITIEIWEGEDLFLHNTQTWITPLNLTTKNQEFIFEFFTKRFSTKPELKCYSGKIVANISSGKWELVRSRYSLTKCPRQPFDETKSEK